jgi:SAM-dependent methyltransferase
MDFKNFGKYIVKVVRLYKQHLPLVVFLKLTVSALSALDPKNPKNSESTKQIDADLKLRGLVLPPAKHKISSPYFSNTGKHELKKQIINSLALSTVYIPSRKFCLFAERYLLGSRVEFSFAKAIAVSRLINKSLKVRHPHEINYSVLCIGCRDAIEIAFLKRYFQHLPGLHVTGIDISVVDDDDIIEGDMHNMPFEDGKFDIIISCHSLEHCVEPAQVATEIKRVAKKNALIGIEVPVINPNGTNPARIYAGGDNWDFCNPTVLYSLFKKDFKLLDQEVIPTTIRVVMQCSSNQ